MLIRVEFSPEPPSHKQRQPDPPASPRLFHLATLVKGWMARQDCSQRKHSHPSQPDLDRLRTKGSHRASDGVAASPGRETV
jgi:hypothetical protein